MLATHTSTETSKVDRIQRCKPYLDAVSIHAWYISHRFAMRKLLRLVPLEYSKEGDFEWI